MLSKSRCFSSPASGLPGENDWAVAQAAVSANENARHTQNARLFMEDGLSRKETGGKVGNTRQRFEIGRPASLSPTV
jgi:hypothetical protein